MSDAMHIETETVIVKSMGIDPIPWPSHYIKYDSDTILTCETLFKQSWRKIIVTNGINFNISFLCYIIIYT